jgi:hypothetical protein
MILFDKYGQHQPLNHQAERRGRKGVPPSLSTLADHVGAGTGQALFYHSCNRSGEYPRQHLAVGAAFSAPMAMASSTSADYRLSWRSFVSR